MGQDNGRTELSKRLDSLPIGTDKMVAMGIRHFLTELDPKDIRFSAHPNGFRIEVKTDRDNVKKTKEFWDDKIQGRLEG